MRLSNCCDAKPMRDSLGEIDDMCGACMEHADFYETHDITRETGGEGFTSWIKPVCSCGWEGSHVEAYNNWQMMMVEEQEERHMKMVSNNG